MPSAPLPANASTIRAPTTTPKLPNALNVASRALSVVGLVFVPSGASIRLPRNSPATTRMAFTLLPTSLVHQWLNERVYNDDDQSLFGPAEPPSESITCVDCGGTCHLLTHPPEDNLWQVGDVVAYRCSDCLDRWDLVLAPLGE